MRRHPIQRVHFCPATGHLYTAASNVLHVFGASASVAAGTLLSSWTAPASQSQAQSTSAVAAAAENDDTTPKSKKRKVEQKPQQQQPRPGTVSVNNAISKILTTADGKYVIVATSEDKAVTVFAAPDKDGKGGELIVLSARHLPKRIVDLALADKDSNILCADKFGDVFGIPLFPPPSDDGDAPSESPAAAPKPEPEPAQPAPKPASAADRDEAQRQRQLEKRKAFVGREQAAAERRRRLQVDYNIPFAHDFVLGHVSMLLALATVTLPADHPHAAGREKTWILTGDRDEHIRVTRYPQSAVIDGFCLGHTQFVSALLVPSWDSTTLVSGGGDDHLLVWHWAEGRVVQKVDLVGPVSAALGAPASMFAPETGGVGDEATSALSETEGGRGEVEQQQQQQQQHSKDDESPSKVAVNGLWEMASVGGVLVGVEGVPALFLFASSGGSLQHRSTLPLPGNLLDAAVDAANRRVFASVDAAPLLVEYAVGPDGAEWTAAEPGGGTVAGAVERSAVVEIADEPMATVRAGVLYPARGLRKERGVRDGGAD